MKNNESGRVVYMNGVYVSEKDAKISIFDSALMFGDMVFEMTRSFNKKHFKLKEHLERLLYGIKIYRTGKTLFQRFKSKLGNLSDDEIIDKNNNKIKQKQKWLNQNS